MVYLISILIYLLILGGAKQYQRIFAGRSAKGARTAVTILLWSWLGKDYLPTWAAQLDAVLPAIILSVIALIGVSLLTAEKPLTQEDL